MMSPFMTKNNSWLYIRMCNTSISQIQLCYRLAAIQRSIFWSELKKKNTYTKQSAIGKQRRKV